MREDPFKIQTEVEPVVPAEVESKDVMEELAVEKPPPVVDTKDLTKLTEADVYYNEIDRQGNVAKYKMESGVPVKVAELGNIKEFFNHAIMKAALMTPEEVVLLDFGGMTHIEIAAVRQAMNAAAGDLRAAQEIYDRVLGKAKQVSESTNLNLTIDDILNGVQMKQDEEGSVVNV
jgi:hypothetical protein